MGCQERNAEEHRGSGVMGNDQARQGMLACFPDTLANMVMMEEKKMH